MKDAYQYQADNLTKIWTTVVQAIGAVALAIGGYVGWKNFEATKLKIDTDRDIAQKSLEETKRKIDADRLDSEQNLELAKQQQITNRFTRAIGQLGAS